MKKYLKEIKEEVALCQKYIDECDIFASKSEHEKLALKIASDCEQTLSALADEIKKNDWVSVDEVMPEERVSNFAKYKGTNLWRDSYWEKSSRHVLVVLVNDHDSGIFSVGIGYTVDGQWEIASGAEPHSHVAYWMPFPFPIIASKLVKGE